MEMQFETIALNGIDIAWYDNAREPISDPQTALDVLMNAQYVTGARRLAMTAASLSRDFFVLSSGLAGEVLQKFINYNMKLAIVGDFSGYTSKPLRDFIYESNRGKDIFFVATREEAIERLARV